VRPRDGWREISRRCSTQNSIQRNKPDQKCPNRPDGLTNDRLDGMVAAEGMKRTETSLLGALLDAAEAVVARQGIANLTLEAVAAEAGISKGGLLHHFRTKDRLIEALVARAAENWRACWMGSYEKASEGPGRMTRALLEHCLSDAQSWTEQLRRSSSAVFAALAQDPSLIEPMRATYSDLHRRIAEDGLPPGVGEAVVTAIDGLWLYWVLGLVPVDQGLMNRLRSALEEMLVRSQPKSSSSKKNVQSARRSSLRIKRVLAAGAGVGMKKR
jgi:AcrR family transcriptional regulator